MAGGEYVLKDGRRLLLREATGDDAANCLAYLRIIGGETDYLLIGPEGLPGVTEADEAAFLEDYRTSEDRALLVGFIDGDLACIASVAAKTHRRMLHNANLGLSVRRKYWGNGVGSACMQELILFCRGTGTIKNLCLEVYADNIRAVRLYKKFGFACVGTHKKRFLVNGAYHDEVLMDLPL